MANLETLLEYKPLGKVKKSGKTVMGVYADEEVLDKLRDLCLGNCHSFAPCTYIGEAEHFLKNSGKGFYDPIAVEISLAEQNRYEFIRHLKAEFRDVKVYVTYAEDDSMKTRLEEAQKHMWDNALLVQWPKTQAGSSSQAADDLGVLEPKNVCPKTQTGSSSQAADLGVLEPENVCPKTQAGSSSEAVDFGVLEPKNVCPKTQAGSSSEAIDFGVLEPKHVPSKTQTGSSSEAADLSVLKNAEYNDPEDAIVSSDLQLGLPEDDGVSTKLQLGFSAKRKRDTNDPEE